MQGLAVRAVVAFVVGVWLTALPADARAQQTTPCDQETHTYSKVSRAPRYEPLPQEIFSVPSKRDGVAIQIGIVRPNVPAGVKVPVIVDAGPYYHPMQTLDLRKCAPRLTENFVGQGYAVALVAVRGTGDSGGCMDLFGPGERDDLDQAITWLGTQPWSSGAVGMVGKSYDGSTPWEAASFGNPHLKTIVPIEGVPDIFRLLFGPGTPDWRGPLVLNDIYYAQSVAFYLNGRSPEHTVQVTACPDYATGSAASVYSTQTGELDPFGYWAPRRYRPQVERNYRRPIFLVQGLQDWNVNPGMQFPWVSGLDRDGRYVKYLLGQWGHNNPDDASGAARRRDWPDILLAWFDRWLKGESVDLGPAVEVQDSDGRWRRATQWPPRHGATPLWLAPDGSLADSPPAGSGSFLLAPDAFHTQGGGVFTNDLAAACQTPGCAQFATAPLARTFRFAGLPRLRLAVTPQGPAGQLAVHLYAVGGDGAAQRLGWGQVDLRFPTGGEQSQPVAPGQPVAVDFRLQPLDAVVAKGQRLVLVLSEGTAYNRLPSVPNAPVTLAVDGTASLTVHEVTPSEEDFFTPPADPAAGSRRARRGRR